MTNNNKGRKFDFYERQRIHQLVLECDIMGIGRQETHDYVVQKLGKELSLDYLDYVKRKNKERSHDRLKSFREHRNAFILLKFRHIEEIELYQQKLHELIASTNNPFLKKSCYDSLHELTITKAEMVDSIPYYYGSNNLNGQELQESKSDSESEQQQQQEQPKQTKF